MIDLAQNKVPKSIKLLKTDGTNLPFEDNSFDIVFTATVLQHNTDELMLKELIKEISRVSSQQVILFERIESSIKGDELNYGRPVSYYQDLMNKTGFELKSVKFINIFCSYLVSGIIRKVFNRKNRQEGEALNKFSVILQKASLPFTRLLDNLITSKTDLCRLVFTKV